jgi:hypothetical protein
MKNLPILMATLVVAFSLTNCSEKRAESSADFASVDMIVQPLMFLSMREFH